jgi:hypothetical protein
MLTRRMQGFHFENHEKTRHRAVEVESRPAGFPLEKFDRHFLICESLQIRFLAHFLISPRNERQSERITLFV